MSGTFCYGASNHIVAISSSAGQDFVGIKYRPESTTNVKQVWAKTFTCGTAAPDPTEVCNLSNGWEALMQFGGWWYSSTVKIAGTLGGHEDANSSKFRFWVVVGRHATSMDC